MSFLTFQGGRKFHIFTPESYDYDLDEIARALGHVCRWAGHTYRHYSVAEHSIFVAWEALNRYCLANGRINVQHFRKYAGAVRIYLAGLVHDAAEAFTGDIPRPFKAAMFIQIPGEGMVSMVDYEARIFQAICHQLRLPILTPDELAFVKAADDAMLVPEARSLLGFEPAEEWGRATEGTRWVYPFDVGTDAAPPMVGERWLMEVRRAMRDLKTAEATDQDTARAA